MERHQESKDQGLCSLDPTDIGLDILKTGVYGGLTIPDLHPTV